MTVSIIIPTYNSATWLRRAFESALAQEGVDFEIILVDNNSADGTLALSEQLRTECPGLVHLAKEKKQGSAAARNHGVRLARGEWIQFLDSDDVLLPGKLVRQLSLVKGDTDWVIGAFIQRSVNGIDDVSILNEDPWKGLVHNGGIGHTNSNLLRRNFLLQLGGQQSDMSNCEDMDLYFRLLRAGANVVYDHIPGAVYQDRPGPRLSTQKGKPVRICMLHLIGETVAYLRENRPSYFTEYAPFFYSSILNALRILATSNFKEAVEFRNIYFPRGLSKVELDYSILPNYAKLYSIFGFANIEAVRLGVRHIIPKSLKKIVKGT